jgi:hypothetical protein
MLHGCSTCSVKRTLGMSTPNLHQKQMNRRSSHLPSATPAVSMYETPRQRGKRNGGSGDGGGWWRVLARY